MSTASYFRDEAGVHLNLHMTVAQYVALMKALAESEFTEAREVYTLIHEAWRHEQNKDTGPGGARDIMARFDDSPPKDGV